MNSFGLKFRMTTFGESHGKAIGCVVDGVPAGLEIDEAYIQSELDRRKPGQSDLTTARKESDRVEILSGVFEGKRWLSLTKTKRAGIIAILKISFVQGMQTLATGINMVSATTVVAVEVAQERLLQGWLLVQLQSCF